MQRCSNPVVHGNRFHSSSKYYTFIFGKTFQLQPRFNEYIPQLAGEVLYKEVNNGTDLEKYVADNFHKASCMNEGWGRE